VRVHIPEDDLAVQCGECLQIVTGGLLVATPHAVRASKPLPGQRVGRGTFPVFIDTGAEFRLAPPLGVSRSEVFHRTIASRVPPLEQRWTTDGVPFVDFLGDTFTQYYKWAMQGK
jgi:isopenicillin N synthase-like dioxygenase